ncbi:DUF2931 family protein [Segatella oris]|uniref:DUF2931 family protein n=1 Tax=Segatella oris TaxID=28135 RepID=UPI003612297A
MKYILIVIMVSFAVCVSTACSGLGNKTKKGENKGMDTAFRWEALVASSRNYPMEVHYARVGVGNSGRYVGVMERFTGSGLGEADGTVDMGSDANGGMEAPSSVDIVWLSYLEKKFYRLNVKFSSELQDKIRQKFRSKYYDWPAKRYWSFSGFVINMLPKGHVWLYVDGIGRRELVCDTLVGREVNVPLQDFDEDGYRYRKTLDAFCEGRLGDYTWAEENFKRNGLSDGLWDTYKTKFNYEIEFKFEDEKAALGTDYLYRFLTGEFWHRDNKPMPSALPRVREIQAGWEVGTTIYNGKFYFDEDEIIKGYAEAFKAKGASGKLVIEVSKYNNWFTIYLLVSGKKYPLTKTKIHVFRITPQHLKEEKWPFYNNHPDIYSGDIHYVGG